MPDVLSVGLGGGSHVKKTKVSTLLTHVTFGGFLIIVLKILNLKITSKYFYLVFVHFYLKRSE